MILVTRLNDVSFTVNADLIERITAEPDTTLTLVDGVRYVVRESTAEVIDRITDFRAAVLERAYGLHAVASAQAPEPAGRS